jgi:hypothetical protein
MPLHQHYPTQSFPGDTVPPPPPSAMNGWGRWVTSEVSHVRAELTWWRDDHERRLTALETAKTAPPVGTWLSSLLHTWGPAGAALLAFLQLPQQDRSALLDLCARLLSGGR